jgi:predicted nucleic acid-binding Zn ribbon protein
MSAASADSPAASAPTPEKDVKEEQTPNHGDTDPDVVEVVRSDNDVTEIQCQECSANLQCESDAVVVNKKRVDETGATPLYRCYPCLRLMKRINNMKKGAPADFDTWGGALDSKEARVAFMREAQSLYGSDLKKARDHAHANHLRNRHVTLRTICKRLGSTCKRCQRDCV